MTHTQPSSKRVQPAGERGFRMAFTLIELLTVVAIIALLIGILVPSLGAARDKAKDVKTAALLKAISDGCEMFKNDNEKEFRSSNGYPPSAGYRVDAFAPGVPSAPRKDVFTNPQPTYDMNGAHWLPRFLLGYDLQGFIPLKNVPESLRNEPHKWYLNQPEPGSVDEPLPRVGPYLNPDTTPMVKTMDLTKVQPVPARLSASDNLLGFDAAGTSDFEAPVIVDMFNRPILYYVANPFVARKRGRMATDQDGVPGIFDFRDNIGFTGYDPSASGCRFNASGKEHPIRQFGDPTDPGTYPESFVHFILNHAAGGPGGHETNPGKSFVPFNRETFLLMTTGKDGLYGTADDVNNFQARCHH